jgi:hypothetical protein
MASGDHYASYTDVQKVLMNAGLGVSGNTMFDDTAIEAALDITMAMIHLELDITSKTSTSPYADILKGIQIDMVTQYIIRARFFQDTNLADPGILNSVAGGIAFTDDHLRMLYVIKQKIGVA